MQVILKLICKICMTVKPANSETVVIECFVESNKLMALTSLILVK